MNKWETVISDLSNNANVCSTNSKVTLRTNLEALSKELNVSPEMKQGLEDSEYYAKGSKGILIESEESRKRTDNLHICRRKLHGLVIGIANILISKESADSLDEIHAAREQ